MDKHFLAIETSTSVCEVALLSSRVDGQQIALDSHVGAGEHAEHVLGLVAHILAQADVSRHALSAIAFGQGPGSFTGLRLACGVAQGIAYGLGLPVVPVPSLLALAEAAHAAGVAGGQANPAGLYVCMQDARMGELYLAVYRAPEDPARPWQVSQAPMLLDAASVQPWLEEQRVSWRAQGLPAPVFCGNAPGQLPDLLEILQAWDGGRLDRQARPGAAAVARLAQAAHARGEVLAPQHAMPLYVRDKVAYTMLERARGQSGNPRADDVRPGLPQGISLHEMQEAHLDSVAAIESRVQSFPWTRRNFADGLRAGYPAWVACHEGEPAGFYMALLAPDVAHLLIIAVSPDHQGKGVGRALLAHCEEQARRHQLDVIVLEVRESNTRAIGFYRHLGFAAFATRKDYYPAAHGRRENACVMQKRLKAGKAQS